MNNCGVLPMSWGVTAFCFPPQGRRPEWSGLRPELSALRCKSSVTGDTTIALRLVEDLVVEGHVSLLSGAPAPGVRVTASSQGGEAFYGNTATSGVEGAFRMRLPPGRYQVFADRSTGSASIQWSLGEMLVPPLTVPRFQLPGGAVLEARIDDPSGLQRYLTMSVLPGAFHLVEFGQSSGTRSAYGFLELGAVVEIPVTPGQYSVLVSPGSSSQDYRYHTVVREIIASDHEILQTSLPDPMADLTLTGSVHRTRDDTASSVRIYAYDAEAQLMAEVWVDGDNGYELPLPAGQYEIIATVHTSEDTRVGYHVPSLTLTEDHTLDIELFTQTAIDEDSQTPSHFELSQSFPNPFNAETVIRFSLALPGEARLELFDMLGQRVRTLVESELPAGAAATRWDGTGAGGHPVASGVYLYRLTAGKRVATRKLLLVR